MDVDEKLTQSEVESGTNDPKETSAELDTNQATVDHSQSDESEAQNPVDQEPVADSSPPESQPPAESPVQEQPTPEITSAEEVAASDKAQVTDNASSEQPEQQNEPSRKIELRPTMNLGEAKAVPSIQPSDDEEIPQPVLKTPAEKDASATYVDETGAVEIPDQIELDDQLMGELDAALQSSQQAESAPQSMEVSSPSAPPKDDEELEPGTKLKATVLSTDGDSLIADVGYRSSGVLIVRDLPEDQRPKVGDQIDVVVEQVDRAEGIIKLLMPTAVHRAGGDWSSLTVGQVVECTVNKTNKGGLEITASQLRGFMPASQVDLYFISDLEPFVGQKLQAKVIDVNPKKKNLVVSRKAILEEERERSQSELWEKIQVGETVPGTVKTIKDYGAFVDIGGLDGLLHVGEMSWNRINHPSDILTVGDQVEVKILNVNLEKKKIGLGMKQLLTNPWEYAETKYSTGTVCSGKVTKMTDFGAFVELEPGLEGLIHISEIDHQRINKVSDRLSVGLEVEAKVLEVNANRKRIALSLKALQAKPEPVQRETASEQDSASQTPAQKKSSKALKGGIGGGKSGGGLFGNPSDFS